MDSVCDVLVDCGIGKYVKSGVELNVVGRLNLLSEISERLGGLYF